MLRLEHIQKIYTTGEVLKDINWEVKPGDRIGLVGVNGAGKSTQLKIIAGEIEPTAGNIIKPSSCKIAYLSQEFEVDPQRNVKQELWAVFKEANQAQKQLAEVSHQLEHLTPDQDYEPLLKQLDRAQRKFEALNGYELESRIEKILPELGFAPGDSDRFVDEFSGGWQMRMSLGKILLQTPDLLLLDEPTNHLDLETIEWLETYLKSLKTPMVIVSHDRQFLDRLCNQIVETERGVSTSYLGNYTSYLNQKAELRDAQLSAFERQQRDLEKQQAFVEKFRASATRSTQAKSREKQLEKIERIEAPDTLVKTLRFKFPPPDRSGRVNLEIKNLTHAYGDHILFLGANLIIERGDHVAFVGPNGAGKSTLLKMIMGIEPHHEGEITLGHNVLAGYFEQNQAEALDLTKTVYDTLHDQFPDLTNTEVRTVLGQFLFTGDTVFKKVKDISGGEKARLALALLFLRPLNFLILDEPTNHLDIPAKEMLEQSLSEYEGTVVLVSHDRYFISQVATKIVEFRDGELHVYDGNYDYYLQKKAEETRVAAHEAAEAAKAAKEQAKREKEKQKR
ncbi:MAG: ABC-F family ATP-binding cassette domain-containing protein, partial [Pseudanabaenaceae cyanobacterium bins.68]|nr:ABC-F family ATP-binding cassette domain-containing protein [Pseudanabaenaceae cyanobacterium bins.68]